VADGKAHCVVFVADRSNQSFRLMVDGVYQEVAQSNNKDQLIEATRILFGCVGGEAASGSGFTGDVAEIRMYGKALTTDEMRRICVSRAAKYGARLVRCNPVRYGEEAAYGLGAPNLTVAAGARLRLPLSQTNPFTLESGKAFSCAGEIIGSLRVGAGVSYDVTAVAPTAVQDLQFADGATFAFPIGGQPIAVGSVSSAGSLTVDLRGDVEALTDPLTLFTYTGSASFANVTVTVNGEASDCRIAVKENQHAVLVKGPRGMLLIVR